MLNSRKKNNNHQSTKFEYRERFEGIDILQIEKQTIKLYKTSECFFFGKKFHS
jgi:hypothetical protein